MAMVVKDCAVILLRSPPSNVYKPLPAMDEKGEEILVHGMSLQRIGSSTSGGDTSSALQYAPSWFPLGTQSLCAMTGLAMDVEHLTRVLQKQVDDDLNIFDHSSTTYSMTQELSRVLRNVCLREPTRPLGVQALLVGCDNIDDATTTTLNNSGGNGGGLCMYSLDPSGTWQSWGKASAIGKFGREIRGLLGKKFKALPANSFSAMEIPQAVEHLMDCWLEVCMQQGVNASGDDDWELLVLQKDDK
ncbi:MAG: hypothetical protein SGILL_006537, partial [Bacillariaceae sp.]